jgi:hypothetical protein
MDAPKASPGILTLTSTTNTKVMNISLDIPIQTIRFKSYRVQFDTAANALAAKVLYVELPFISGNQVLDNNLGFVYLPIPVDNAVVTLETSIDLPILLTEHIPQSFTMNIRDGPGSSFALASNLVHITLQFELFKGHSN